MAEDIDYGEPVFDAFPERVEFPQVVLIPHVTLGQLPDGTYFLRHPCLTGPAGSKGRCRAWNAPLVAHQIVSRDPITFTPSIKCECGLHGFIQGGRWIDSNGPLAWTPEA